MSESTGASMRVTHGRHCPCSACAREDWTKIVAPCGMHGEGCPAVYAPISSDAKRRIDVTIRADIRPLIKGLKRAELRCSRSFWRRLRLRFDLWRLRDVH